MKKIFFIIIIIIFTQGCMTGINYLPTGMTTPLETHTIHIDSRQLRYYTFTIGSLPPDTYLFFIGGSGCASLRYYLRGYLKGLKGNIRVFALQKQGVGPFTTGLFGCPEEFYKNDYFERRVNEQKAFITHILEHDRGRPENIVILGVSEGCTTAAVLANRLTSVTHLAMIGCGGMKFIDELRLLRDRGDVSFDVDALYETVLKEPESTSRFIAGHTYRYWASILEVNPSRFLLDLDIPVIVAMGEKDRSVPVESVLYLKALFERAEKDNLTVLIYPDADHTLKSSHRDYREEFLKRTSIWIYQNR